MNNLNRITEENIKTIFKQSETIEKMRNTNEALLEKSDKHDKQLLKLQNEILKFNDVEKGLREHNSRLEEGAKNFSDFSYFVNKKFGDMDSSLLNMIDTMAEFNKQAEKKGNSVNMNNVLSSAQATNEAKQKFMAW